MSNEQAKHSESWLRAMSEVCQLQNGEVRVAGQVGADRALTAANVITALTTERDALRAALEQLKSDCQCTIDLHDRVGPTWTVKGHGMYDESFVLAKMAELIGVVNAALTANGEGE